MLEDTISDMIEEFCNENERKFSHCMHLFAKYLVEYLIDELEGYDINEYVYDYLGKTLTYLRNFELGKKYREFYYGTVKEGSNFFSDYYIGIYTEDITDLFNSLDMITNESETCYIEMYDLFISFFVILENISNADERDLENILEDLRNL